MNIKLLRKIVAHIKANPEHWQQSAWHCGTSHCVAGFAELDAAGYSLSTRVFNKKVDGLRWKSPYKKPKLTYGARFWNFIKARRKEGFSTATCDIGRDHLQLTAEESAWLFDGTRLLDQLSEVARTGKFPDHVYRGQ